MSSYQRKFSAAIRTVLNDTHALTKVCGSFDGATRINAQIALIQNDAEYLKYLNNSFNSGFCLSKDQILAHRVCSMRESARIRSWAREAAKTNANISKQIYS